jgi:hypothetical protein
MAASRGVGTVWAFGDWVPRHAGSKCYKSHLYSSVRVSLDPTYIRRWHHITDEYRPRIFIDDVALPTNI